MSNLIERIKPGVAFLCNIKYHTDENGVTKRVGAATQYRKVKYVYLDGGVCDTQGEFWHLAVSEHSTSGLEALR